MTFATDLAALPFTAREANAKGFLAPIFRTIGHLLYVLGWIADEEKAPSDEELLAELNHATEHWSARDDKGAISTTTRETLNRFGITLESAVTEFPDWDRETRIRNLRDLGNRAAGLAVLLDRELVGIRDSDAGYTL